MTHGSSGSTAPCGCDDRACRSERSGRPRWAHGWRAGSDETNLRPIPTPRTRPLRRRRHTRLRISHEQAERLLGHRRVARLEGASPGDPNQSSARPQAIGLIQQSSVKRANWRGHDDRGVETREPNQDNRVPQGVANRHRNRDWVVRPGVLAGHSPGDVGSRPVDERRVTAVGRRSTHRAPGHPHRPGSGMVRAPHPTPRPAGEPGQRTLLGDRPPAGFDPNHDA
jgi:hypothetical protein